MTRRVLFPPHNVRHDYFHTLLEHAKEHAGWECGVVCVEENRKAFIDVVPSSDRLFFLSDFSKVTKWEKDDAARGRIRALIEDSERLCGLSANRIVLLGERDIGRGYGAEFYHWPLNRLARQTLSDNGMPRTVVERMFAFMNGVLTRFRRDLVMSGSTNAMNLATLILARRTGIPFIINRPSKIHFKRCFWTTDQAMLNLRARYRNADKARTSGPRWRPILWEKLTACRQPLP